MAITPVSLSMYNYETLTGRRRVIQVELTEIANFGLKTLNSGNE